MSEPTILEIETIYDILEKVPEDRIDYFLEDLRGMFELYHRISDCLDAVAKEKVRTTLGKFVWTDDGKHNIKIEFAEKGLTKYACPFCRSPVSLAVSNELPCPKCGLTQ